MEGWHKQRGKQQIQWDHVLLATGYSGGAFKACFNGCHVPSPSARKPWAILTWHAVVASHSVQRQGWQGEVPSSFLERHPAVWRGWRYPKFDLLSGHKLLRQILMDRCG